MNLHPLGLYQYDDSNRRTSVWFIWWTMPSSADLDKIGITGKSDQKSLFAGKHIDNPEQSKGWLLLEPVVFQNTQEDAGVRLIQE